MLVTFV